MATTQALHRVDMEKHAAMRAALEELFRQHPLQGSLHHPRKAKGIANAQERRAVALDLATVGSVSRWSPEIIAERAKAWRIPIKQFAAIHALIYR